MADMMAAVSSTASRSASGIARPIRIVIFGGWRTSVTSGIRAERGHTSGPLEPRLRGPFAESHRHAAIPVWSP